MNGIHDMGGMHGMGQVRYDPHEPVFHEPWEGRAWGIMRATGRWGRGRWGNTRFDLERLPPADYLRMSYYEKWFTIVVNRLVRSGFVTAEELAAGKADPSRPAPTLPASDAKPLTAPSARQNLPIKSVFRIGQRVRGRNINPEGHTRMPRYTRGRVGHVVRLNGVFALQDTDARGQLLGRQPQQVYTVQFAARELWGDQASMRDTVHVDMWEDYLERA
jgi:nitrile hydratase